MGVLPPQGAEVASGAGPMRMRGMTRAAFAVIGLALLVAAALWLLGRSGKAELTVPALGAASAQSLPDGRPVFVVRHSDNAITVLDAFSTHTPSGVFKLVAWCPQQRLFTDLIHGATYDEWGSKVGGPAPVGMTVDTWQPIGDGIEVTGNRGPAAAPRTPRHPADWSTCRFVIHEFDAAQAFAPGEALQQPQQRWVLVKGGLDLARGRLCRVPLPANCDKDFAPASGVEAYPGDESWASFVSADWLWLAWNNGDALEHVTLARAVNSP